MTISFGENGFVEQLRICKKCLVLEAKFATKCLQTWVLSWSRAKKLLSCVPGLKKCFPKNILQQFHPHFIGMIFIVTHNICWSSFISSFDWKSCFSLHNKVLSFFSTLCPKTHFCWNILHRRSSSSCQSTLVFILTSSGVQLCLSTWQILDKGNWRNWEKWLQIKGRRRKKR